MNSMNYIGKFISNFRDFYNEINTATLTGAIDVVVVEQADGTFSCSPFHVRFGKLGVLRSREKVVDMEINGEPLELQMKLGDSGEAFFVEEVPLDELGHDVFIPPHLACSPIPSETFLSRYAEADPAADGPRGAARDPSAGWGTVDEMDTLRRPAWPQVDARKAVSCPEVRPVPVRAQELSLVVTGGGEGGEDAEPALPGARTFRAETMQGKVSEKVRRISIVTGEFRPIGLEAAEDAGKVQAVEGDATETKRDVEEVQEVGGEQPSVDERPGKEVAEVARLGTSVASVEDAAGEASSNGQDVKAGCGGGGGGGSGGKKKRRKKSFMKKKNAGKKVEGNKPDVATMKEVLEASAQIHAIGRRADLAVGESLSQSVENIFEIDDIGDAGEAVPPPALVGLASDTTTEGKICLSNEDELASLKHTNKDTNFHFFSDTEVTPGTSPLDSRPSSPIQSDSEAERQRHEEGAGGKACEGVTQSWRWGELPTPPTPRTSRQVSSSGLPLQDADASQDPSAAAAAAEAQRSILSEMFSFMKKTKRLRHNPEADGIYLADIKTADLDPEVAAIYFPTSYRQGSNAQGDSSREEDREDREEDRESGNGTSLPQSPHSVDGSIGGPKSSDSDFGEPNHPIFPDTTYNEISMSLCGGLDENGPDEQAFEQCLITYEDLVAEPKIIENPGLVVRLDGKYYNWKTACPMVMSVVVYQRALPQHVIDEVTADYMPHPPGQQPGPPADGGGKAEPGRGYASWFSWRKAEPKKMGGDADGAQELRRAREADAGLPSAALESGPDGRCQRPMFADKLPIPADVVEMGHGDCAVRRPIPPPLDAPEIPAIPAVPESPSATGTPSVPEAAATPASAETAAEPTTPEVAPTPATWAKDAPSSLTLSVSAANTKDEDAVNGWNSSEDSDASLENRGRGGLDGPDVLSYYEHSDLYRKTLRLSSEQIAKLRLVEGANEVVFSVTTAYQGTTRCKCHIYKWRHDDKIVVSDIDGTITKSDVLGHILPIVGKDWAQSGVAQLFTKIQNNGYRLLYLSARAIGQARVTREYLRSIRQGDLSLPDGPLLLNPTSLISAFHREVIEKKPEEFKISCLRDIHALFPADSEPFYAGYGNKVNDVWAYRAVGIPIFRIFTINHRGELKHELTQTFQSSYSNMSFIVDQMFPPPPSVEPSGDFSSFVYWREPIADINIELPVKDSPSKILRKVPNNKVNLPRKAQ